MPHIPGIVLGVIPRPRQVATDGHRFMFDRTFNQMAFRNCR